MRSRRRAGFGGLVLGWALVGVLAGATPLAVTARSVDCDAPDLERVEADLAVARAAVVAGNQEALQAAIDSAREQLDAIAHACWSAPASPLPSLPPIELGGSTTVGDRPVAFPGDLEIVEDGLLRPVDRDGLQADALTVADSQASGQLLSSQPEGPVPAGFRVISLAVGDPVAALVAVGAIEADAAIPDDPVGALEALVAAVEAQSGGGDVGITFGEPGAFTFDDGVAGATVDLQIRNLATDEIYVAGMFQLRPLADGDRAIGVGFAAPDGVERIRAELAATLTSIGEPAAPA